MIRNFCWNGSAVVAFVLSCVPAQAQRATDNAVTNADDAFGISIGQETSGIYSETDTRGFSPTKAGNARIDGIYYDPVGSISLRLKKHTVIRVGFAAETYPFAAPTGIADQRFHPLPTELGATLVQTLNPYGGMISEADARVPIVPGKIGIIGGIARASMQNADASYLHSWGFAGRLFLRFGGFEIAPFMSHGFFPEQQYHPTIIVRGEALPKLLPVRKQLLQPWLSNRSDSRQYGVTIKGAIGEHLTVRAGLFRSGGHRFSKQTEIFTLLDAAGNASHRLIGDPLQHTVSTSGEVLVSYRIEGATTTHRIFAGYRGRNRLAEAGGSDSLDLGTILLGDFRLEPEYSFSFGPINSGRIRQSSLMLGYLGSIKGLGGINLGLQKARYRATANNGSTGAITQSRDDPWLYNASLFANLSRSLSAYIGLERGLEDNGLAPDSAANRAEQLPATQTTQLEGGIRWKLNGATLVVNGFQIEKPYFAADSTGTFSRLGKVRHRGMEMSLSGQFGKRLHIVGGAVLMQPRLLGAATSQGTRPAGTPSVFARLDANYRTDILGGLTPTMTLLYTGRRAVGALPTGATHQLMLPAITTIDLGLRHNFHIGRTAASIRANVQNVFDKGSWKVISPNVLNMDETRRFTLVLTADL